METTTIIGLHGCYCHPYKSWEEERKFSTQKLKVGAIVSHRCFNKVGVVDRVLAKQGYVIVKYGPLAADLHSEHVANLIQKS